MNKFLNILAAQLLFLWGSTPAVYAQKSASPLPRYFEISNAGEWTSPLLEFDEPVEGFRLTVFKTSHGGRFYKGYPYVCLGGIDITDAEGKDIPYVASTNSLSLNDGGGLQALQDKNDNTYYHSAQPNDVSIGNNDYVYIDIAFAEPQSSFTYRQVRRAEGYDFPLHFTLSPLGVEANPPFNPTNPGEPDAGGEKEPEKVYYTVTVAATPAGVANVSGGGTVLQGSSVYVNTSAKNSKYVFKEEPGGEKRIWWKALLKTYAAYAGGYLLNVVLLIFWIDVLKIGNWFEWLAGIFAAWGIDRLDAQTLGEIVAAGINLIITVPLNYVVNKYWAFKRP